MKLSRITLGAFATPHDAIGVMFTDKREELHRQAIIIPRGAEPAEVAARLEQLAAFLRDPDERMIVGTSRLSGYELNADQFRDAKDSEFDYASTLHLSSCDTVVVDGVKISGAALAILVRGDVTLRFTRNGDTVNVEKVSTAPFSA